MIKIDIDVMMKNYVNNYESIYLRFINKNKIYPYKYFEDYGKIDLLSELLPIIHNAIISLEENNPTIIHFLHQSITANSECYAFDEIEQEYIKHIFYYEKEHIEFKNILHGDYLKNPYNIKCAYDFFKTFTSFNIISDFLSSVYLSWTQSYNICNQWYEYKNNNIHLSKEQYQHPSKYLKISNDKISNDKILNNKISNDKVSNENKENYHAYAIGNNILHKLFTYCNNIFVLICDFNELQNINNFNEIQSINNLNDMKILCDNILKNTNSIFQYTDNNTIYEIKITFDNIKNNIDIYFISLFIIFNNIKHCIDNNDDFCIMGNIILSYQSSNDNFIYECDKYEYISNDILLNYINYTCIDNIHCDNI